MRKIVTVLALVAMFVGLGAAPAGARKIYGCDSLLNWPCPGPAL